MQRNETQSGTHVFVELKPVKVQEVLQRSESCGKFRYCGCRMTCFHDLGSPRHESLWQQLPPLTHFKTKATEQPSWSFRLLLLVFGRRGSNLLLSLWETSSSLYFVKFMLKNLLSHPQIEPVTCSLSSGYTYCTRMHTYAHSRSTYFDLHIFQNFIYHLSCAPPPHTPHTHIPTHPHTATFHVSETFQRHLVPAKVQQRHGKGGGIYHGGSDDPQWSDATPGPLQRDEALHRHQSNRNKSKLGRFCAPNIFLMSRKKTSRRITSRDIF